ncbi:MAG TPA: DUF2269 family protein [Solirubrobacteraceae bacterium]|nr:DUF2269 family protein [Solirubrobacteraceae bacterium]
MPLAASFYDFVVGVHVLAVTVAFGVVFAFPVIRLAAARGPDAAGAHRLEYTVARYIVNPGLVVVLAAGIYLASSGHHWHQFFVQWGLAMVVVIGALVGAVLIPTAKKAEAAVGGTDYEMLSRRLVAVGWAVSLLVTVTIVLMAVQA